LDGLVSFIKTKSVNRNWVIQRTKEMDRPIINKENWGEKKSKRREVCKSGWLGE